ncbi:terminase small subunit [Mammaliicoccus vitulinus]|uniref:terminase small subunit n=1 Tax=Mammaliicoccus TaxID=2803850 RepID=UPI001071E5AF|nr:MULTISPECIES: terminase small subunit [Mammaliicoccus]MBF0750455.1 terminase small subunit [Mammaliicoccus lentus]MBM6628572.1 terminase small subunit [Mammaliicoccus vitulinus]TFU56499.1 terminase small subunit [Mammaliicoccus lentus]
MVKLNKRQRTFAEAYAIPGTEMYGNATKSAIHAGYSERSAEVTGSRMLSNAKVLEYIKGVENKLFDENIMSGKEVLYRLTQTARGETKEIDVVVTKQGLFKENPDTGINQLVYDEDVHLISKPPKMSDQNKALELLGKHHKLFTEVSDMNITGVVKFDDDIN